MGVIALPQRHLAQPQYFAPIDTSPLTNGLVSAVIFDNPGSLVDRVTQAKYPVTSAATALEAPGRVLRFTGTASYVNTGTQRLGGVDLFASAGNPWSVVIYARLISSIASGSFIAKCGATAGNRQFQLYRDQTIAAADPSMYLRGGQTNLDWDWNSPDWHQYTVTWDGATANIYGDNTKSQTLTVGAAAAESENIVFGARTAGSGFLLNGQLAYAYFYNRAISQEESVRLFRNPWQIFEAPSRRIYVTAAAGSTGTVAVTNADDTSSAAGTTTVTGTLATTNSNDTSSASGTVGSVSGTVDYTNANDTSAASGTTTVTGSSATTNADDASTASGAVGSSVSGTVAYTNLPDTSSASGTTTATGTVSVTNANDSSAASGTTTVLAASAVTNANDTSNASGIVGSVTGTVAYTNRNDTCNASGTSGVAVEAQDFGGDDAPIIIRKRKKKTLREQPNKHLEHILNLAVEEFQGKTRSTLKLSKNKRLEAKEPAKGLFPDPAPSDSNSIEFEGIKTLEDSEKDAEKVAQLLAAYQQQVAAQDDEDLIMLLAELF